MMSSSLIVYSLSQDKNQELCLNWEFSLACRGDSSKTNSEGDKDHCQGSKDSGPHYIVAESSGE